MRSVEEIRKDYEMVINNAEEGMHPNTLEAIRKSSWVYEEELRAALTASIPLDRLEAICTAEREGRCVVLPCKVGDTVYVQDQTHPVAQIEEIRLSRRAIEYQWASYDVGPETCECWDDGYFTESDIGKTVFLTRDEAETALAAKEASGDAER